MNILVSYNWLKEYLKTSVKPGEFVRRMTEVGNSVEHVDDVSERFANMVVGKVLEVNAHPNADKLRVANVLISPPFRGGDGGGDNVVQIVCGGSNLEVDQSVAVALPGAMVKWHGEGELVEIKETELRGVNSFGMICAPEEIGFEKLHIGDPSTGSGPSRMIWDLTGITNVKPGTPLAKALELDDLIFDIEATTNRPDAMSIVGLAREASAAGLGTFTWKAAKAPKAGKLKLNVQVEAKDLCPRYQAIVIEGVKVGPSPWWLQKRLLFSGHRPINNVVDVTNYLLHELGQPLHAFDADKLAGEKIIVRTAKAGESIKALDGKEYKLDSSMLVIADAENPVAVAGVMGGELTGTTESTTRIVIESAIFDSVSVRRTARSLNLYSDSSSLFEKGLSTESTTPALHRAVELICELTGGHVASSIADVRAKPYKALAFPYDPLRVSQLIGVDVNPKQQKEILTGLGFVISPPPRGGAGGGGHIMVPYWRDHDIEASVDFSEEVARMIGYDTLPSVLPQGVIPTPPLDQILVWERRLKTHLKNAGLTETYSNAFVSAADLSKLDITLDAVVHIQNPLSEDIAYMRPSIWPSMLNAVEQNQHRFPHAELFEIAMVHEPRKGDIPGEHQRLALAVYDHDGAAAFRRLTGLLERVLRESGAEAFTFRAVNNAPYLHPGRSALVTVGDETCGTIGELAPLYVTRFGIDKRVALVDIDLDRLLPHLGHGKKYQPVSTFQDTVRDISFVVSERSTYAELVAAVQGADPLIQEVTLLDVYQGKGIEPGKKSIALRLNLRANDHTLSSEEADVVIKKITDLLQKQFSAIIR